MNFPQTRHTLIQRLAVSSNDADWREFMADYWGPICRFAMRQGRCNLADAEDVASQTFEVLVSKQLLTRWISNRSAKLRTLLCSVARNFMANRARVEGGRARLLRDHVESAADGFAFDGLDATSEQVDAFYVAWVEELLQHVVEQLLTEYHQSGKGDYFRVLYGRICEQSPTAEIADSLSLKVSTAENYYKAARKRLTAVLEQSLQEHVGRYTAEADRDEEFASEWKRLGDFLTAHGGLELVVRQAYDGLIPPQHHRQQLTHIKLALSRMLPQASESAN